MNNFEIQIILIFIYYSLKIGIFFKEVSYAHQGCIYLIKNYFLF